MPKLLRNILIAVLALAAAFAAGRFTAGKHIEYKEVRDEQWTQEQVAKARAEWEKTTHSTTTSTTMVVKSCPPANCNPSPEGCVPPCATDCSKCPKQTESTTTTTTTDTTEHGSSSSTTNTTEHGTSHTTTTVDETTGGGLLSSKRLSLSLIASAGVVKFDPSTFGTSFGLGVNYRLVGPLGVGAAVYTTKDVTTYANLKLDEWLVTGGAKTNFSFSGVSYGGSVSRRVFGPFWLGAWGYTDGSAGLSATFTIP